MSGWLSTVEGFVAAAIPAVGLVYTYTTSRRSQYERVLELTGQVSTPPVSDDRHTVGTAFEPMSSRDLSKPVELKEHHIKALFNVLWYFERAHAVYISLQPFIGSRRITRVQALILDTLTSAMDVWTSYLSVDWIDEAGNEVGAKEATPSLKELVKEQARLQEQRAQGPFRQIMMSFGREDTAYSARIRPGA